MPEIKLLPQNVINKIAAGEVIERPSNIVKELIENSLDARASSVKIYIENSGLNKIQIIDDGHGMSDIELQKCFMRYFTSKIFEEEDLFTINSFGFRGEALYSIACVTDITIKSRCDNQEFGNFIKISDNKKIDYGSVGIPKGTDINISNLFSTFIPRKRFLKSPQIEFKNIIDIVSDFALSHSDKSFFLFHNKKEVLSLFSSDINTRLNCVLGQNVSSNLFTINFENPYIKISGFISKPQIASKSKSKQFLFVNKRKVNLPKISSIVRQAYGTLLDSYSNPPYVLFFDIAPQAIDVNVHPKKDQVAFLNENFINSSVLNAITECLQKNDLTYIKQSYLSMNKALLSKKDFSSSNRLCSPKSQKILQIHNLYLVKQTPQGLMIFDQHAVHEKIIYEKLLYNYKLLLLEEKSVPLDFAVKFDLSFTDTQMLESNINYFINMGFDIQNFGKNTFKINGVPKILHDRNIVGLIMDVLDDLSENGFINSQSIDQKGIRALSYMACRCAIKSGENLNQARCENLISEFEQTKTNYTCPHGRPAKIEISLKELNKMFKRF